MPFVLKVDECKSSPKWCSVSFNCPVEMRERLDELARQACWSRGKFIFHLMDKILPDVSVSNPFEGEDK